MGYWIININILKGLIILNRTKTVTGFCPHLNRDHSIDIKFADVSYKGHPDQWKQIQADCEYEPQCSSREVCPVVRLPEALHF